MFVKFFSIILILAVCATLVAAIAPGELQAQGLKNAAGELINAGKKAGTGDSKSPEVIVGQVINAVLSFVGVVFLALTVYGGMIWMTASGNEEKVKKGRAIIVRAIVGICIVFLAYAITYFISRYVVGAPNYQV